MFVKEFRLIGEKLFMRGLNNSHSGNISIRRNDYILISRTGSMLDSLTEDDIVRVSFNNPNPYQDNRASMELIVHRAIYHANKNVKAIVHAHPPYSLAMADNCDKIIPYDQEGAYFFKKIPVMYVEQAIASNEVAAHIGHYVDHSHAVIVSRHGVFAWGETLEEAYHYVTAVESVCRLNYLVEIKNAVQKR